MARLQSGRLLTRGSTGYDRIGSWTVKSGRDLHLSAKVAMNTNPVCGQGLGTHWIPTGNSA